MDIKKELAKLDEVKKEIELELERKFAKKRLKALGPIEAERQRILASCTHQNVRIEQKFEYHHRYDYEEHYCADCGKYLKKV